LREITPYSSPKNGESMEAVVLTSDRSSNNRSESFLRGLCLLAWAMRRHHRVALKKAMTLSHLKSKEREEDPY